MSKIKLVRAAMLLPALMVSVAACSQGESQMTEEAPTTVQLSEADLATATMSVVWYRLLGVITVSNSNP